MREKALGGSDLFGFPVDRNLVASEEAGMWLSLAVRFLSKGGAFRPPVGLVAAIIGVCASLRRDGSGIGPVCWAPRSNTIYVISSRRAGLLMLAWGGGMRRGSDVDLGAATPTGICRRGSAR
jgi:hypothetical protein